MGIRLTPDGRLRWDPSNVAATPRGFTPEQDAFDADWRGALFALAAGRAPVGDVPSLHYWQQFAQRYLTCLCHVTETEGGWNTALDAPSDADCAGLLLAAPPFRGGEYLSKQTLQSVWRKLDDWARENVAAVGGLTAFLEAKAPKWRQVGRVCFHLAENKNDAERPFAFMATYASGFGAAGRMKHLPLRKALEQYAGAGNRGALVKLLSPVQQATKTCDWVKELVDSGDIYRAMAWSPAEAYGLLCSAPTLEASGLSVRLPDWWRKRPRPQVSVTIGSRPPSALGVDAMLDFDVRVALGDDALSLAALESLLEGEDDLVLLRGHWVEVDRDKLRQAIEHWQALKRQPAGSEISFIEGMRLLAGASADLRHEVEMERERAWVHVEAGTAMREILEGLRQPGALDAASDDELRGTLRPYQHTGLNWLTFVTRLGLGACLADDMGLGKTVQVLALLLRNRQGNRRGGAAPSLLVVPASLLGNWHSEAARFAPSLKVLFLHPAETDQRTLTAIASEPAQRLAEADLVVTTYAMLVRQTWLQDLRWRLVVLDEAQAVKNPATRQSRAVRKLAADARIALTGTPVENSLGDLWAIFDFLNPGLLGSRKVFQAFAKELQGGKENRFAPLRRLVGPYILRRLKTDRSVISDLPEKTVVERYCHLTTAQAKLYDQVVRTMTRELESRDGMERRGLVLRSLLHLKQVCNHPCQFLGTGEYATANSGKFLRLAEICEELAERQEKILVFTQFRQIIEPLAEHLAAVFGRPGLVLHGATQVRRRRSLVDRFQDADGPPFLVLSLKAGGTGLNLTAASHVMHFDRWWNPAVENQATDRAFRIGQKRNVLVHKFIVRGTVEERIDDMIEGKRRLAEDILTGDGEVSLTELSDDELLDLVRLDVSHVAS